MAISVQEYVCAVRANVPEARELVDRLAEEHQGVALVVRVNRDLTLLLLWSWRIRDLDTCGRVLGVMERALVVTGEDDYAPVYNSVGIGVVETLDRDLAPDDFAAFVEMWPPAMRERGLLMTAWDDDFDDEGPDKFRPPLRLRMRWALRHPFSSRLGWRGFYAG